MKVTEDKIMKHLQIPDFVNSTDYANEEMAEENGKHFFLGKWIAKNDAAIKEIIDDIG